MAETPISRELRRRRADGGVHAPVNRELAETPPAGRARGSNTTSLRSTPIVYIRSVGFEGAARRLATLATLAPREEDARRSSRSTTASSVPRTTANIAAPPPPCVTTAERWVRDQPGGVVEHHQPAYAVTPPTWRRL